ncbi:hypothetical protein [Mesorhizobium sp. 1M-11]|uniref:hypothetical protein n=1 Tax=Mesorhizobium sp. 1M-11 TaxID=1529006 RepID=UPI0006C74F8E|nr:hypothetical protein [Mesorhizobium sp. 1M-11]
MNASETHNRLAGMFVDTVAGQTSDHSELMVVIESTILATMLISRRVYGLSPEGCVEMVEMAIQQATDRFAANKAKS